MRFWRYIGNVPRWVEPFVDSIGPWGFVLLALCLVGSALTAIHLWRRRRWPLWKRALLTPMVFLPLLGPLFYFGVLDPPPPWGSSDSPSDHRTSDLAWLKDHDHPP